MAIANAALDSRRHIHFSNEIKSFGPGDAIDFTGKAADGLSDSGHRLKLTKDGRTVATIRHAEYHAASDFAFADDGHGGTRVTLSGASPSTPEPQPLATPDCWTMRR